MVLFFIFFFIADTAVNYYIFRRGWQALEKMPVLRPFYTVALVIAVYGYVLTKALDKYLSVVVYDIIYDIGAFWFAYLLYLILFIILLDITRFLESRFHFLPKIIYEDYKFTKIITAAAILTIVSIIVFLGYLNKNDLTVREININLPKGNCRLSELNIVMASDIHLSVTEGDKAASRIVDKINSLSPDVILFAGDVFDDKAEILTREGIGESFKRLKSKYGTFSINGNHEYINYIEQSMAFMKTYNIKVLRDEYVFVDSSFYIIGREDISKGSFTGIARKSLEQITKTITVNYPKILLDHSPFMLEQAVNNKIDLQLSGHTHHGQMWPLNYITKMIYEISWGYKKKGNTHFYVSSGASIWGAPVRTGSKSEVVNIRIKFI
jgi:uncharacterized protein